MPKEQKRFLLQKWLSAHALGRCAQLFAGGLRPYYLSGAAEAMLKAYEGSVSMALYVVYLDQVQSGVIPVYVGKSAHPLRRWRDGHCRNLTKVWNGKKSGLYARWIQLLEREQTPSFIMCVGEKDILFPPIPEFPLTVGSIEYQLISLASDAFEGFLLNSEGRSR